MKFVRLLFLDFPSTSLARCMFLIAAIAAVLPFAVVLPFSLPALYTPVLLTTGISLFTAGLALQPWRRRIRQVLAGHPDAAKMPLFGIEQIGASVERLFASSGEQVAVLLHERDSFEGRYRLLTDNLAASVVIRDQQGKITYCSPFTEVLTGYSLSEIYNASADFFVSVVHEEDREKYQRALRVNEFGEAFQFRYRFFHKTGIEMWAETRTVPILNESGAVVASLSITLDVTGSVRYQRQVEEKNRELQDFTYMVSHDLKAPLFTIKGMLSIISEDYGGKMEPGLEEALTHISKAGTRLEKLISSVLEYSKIASEESVAESVDIKAVIEDVKSDFVQAIQDSRAEIVVDSDLPTVRADRLKVYRIFSNLVGNALKYRNPNRPPHITISRGEPRHSRMCSMSVSDNGIGIPQDRLKDIFRLFQRVHSTEVEGSGIGLASVKKLVEKLGGEITVESTLGEGSTFTFSLPEAHDVWEVHRQR